ncbi:MAG: polyphosphate polymerase domain-containing protein [Oscillospiraceae bacterium]|nr:polyphosphate polymerase domain-containing protein [Oscillospiraceae bacterium]
MAYQTVFKRYELKYIITEEQKEKMLKVMEPYMALDQYGRTVIRNIYFDTDNYRLIRRSIEKPTYKEKLRIRSYNRAKPQSTVFVEVKKKYDSIVYKRRISLSEESAMNWVQGRYSFKKQTQISNEIDYFLSYYKTLHPVAFLSYEREAFYSLNGDDFRVTFDDTILCREEDLSLEADVWGTPILDDGKILMEIKCSGGIPIWMAHFLSEEKIYKTSFSKYGTAYEKLIYNKQHQEEKKYA